MGPEEFETDFVHIAPLGNDSIPDANQSHFCHSCESPFTGVYCTACGQKNDDYRRSLFSLGKEFLGSITAIESRIWRTWAALLFKPGKVAREYANGRRTHWSSPVRVYIAMSILLFGFLSVTQTQLVSIDVDVKPIDGMTKPAEELTSDDVKLVPSLRFFETIHEIEARIKSRNFDLIALRLQADNSLKQNAGAEDLKETLNSELQQAIEDDKLSPETAAIAQEALRELTAQAQPFQSNDNEDQTDTDASPPKLRFSNLRGQVYELDSWSEILFEIIRNPDEINAPLFKYLPRIMFIMMPFTMLIGAIFIRGRGNALLYDHLVHAAYIHAVAFFLLLLGILLSFIFPGATVSKALFVIMLFYLPLSLKRMFRRGWLKTIWTSYGVGFIYAFNMTIIMTALLGVQVVNTVSDMGTPLTP